MTAHRVITAHVPRELALQVDALSERLERPRGWVLKEALANYVELEARRHALTLEAMDDVRAGRVIDHAEVEAWVASLPGPRGKRRKAQKRRR